MVAVLVENYISRHFEVRRTATIDATGVIIGTIIALVIIKLFSAVYVDRTALKSAILGIPEDILRKSGRSGSSNL